MPFLIIYPHNQILFKRNIYKGTPTCSLSRDYRVISNKKVIIQRSTDIKIVISNRM